MTFHLRCDTPATVPTPALAPPDGPMATSAATALATFGRLDAEAVRYAVWKGSVRLEANLRGAGDLDVLVHPDDLPSFRRVLLEQGWRRPTPLGPPRPHAEDHVLLDESTGRLVHLDLLLPPDRSDAGSVVDPAWLTLVLETRRPGPAGVAVPDPAVEAALLLVRLAAEARPWHRYLAPIGRRDLPERRTELATLLAATTPQAVREVLSVAGVHGPAVAAAATTLQGLSWPRLLRLRAALLRTGSLPPATLRDRSTAATRLQRRIRCHLARVVLGRSTCPGRGLPQGGLLVAVLGTDGSGKSTLVHRLHGVYGGKFATSFVYLGSGQGRSSLLRLPLKLVRDLIRPPKRTPDLASSPHRSPLVMAERAVWALTLGREKRAKLRSARRARAHGELVICDRYPQTQIAGELDGPLLASWATSPRRPLRRLAAVERRDYDRALRTAPDLVLVLDLDPTIAATRRPGMDPAYLARRARLLRSLRWEPRTRIEVIDAGAPADEVLRLASRAVWRTAPT